MDYCSEIGIPYDQMLNLTWLEFDYISKGYEHRMQRNWDFVRNLMATQFNSSGFSKKRFRPRDIMTLPYIDNSTVKKKPQLMDEETFNKMLTYFKN